MAGKGWRWRLRCGVGAAGGLAIACICALLVPWGELGDIASWPRADKLAGLGIILGFAFTAAQVVGPSWWEDRKRRHRPAAPDVTAELRTQWRDALAHQVLSLRRGQLDLLVSLDHQIEIAAVATTRRQPSPDTRAAREEPTGGTVHVSELPRLWEHGGRRMVLLGEPGSGKSYAALSLTLATTEDAIDQGGPVAELFLLADWYRWHLEHPNDLLKVWLVDELTTTHKVPPAVADTLLATDDVVPVLDGLDEIPAHARQVCTQRIAEYSGRTTRRAFFLSCRFEEYHDLADWVGADHTLTIRPLTVDAIASTILATPGRHPAWNTIVRDLYLSANPLARLLSTPLLLSTALTAYKTVDPTELVARSPTDAEAAIWNHFLTPNGPVTYRHHGLSDIHRWLTWLATRMEYTDRQTIAVHELSFLNRTRYGRRGKLVIGLVFGLASGLVFGLGVGLAFGLGMGLAAGLFALLAGMFGWLIGDDRVKQPPNLSVVGIRQGLKLNQIDALVGGLFLGLVLGLGMGLVLGLVFGLLSALFMAVYGVVRSPQTVYTPDRSDLFESQNPKGALRASARSGVVKGLMFGLFYSLFFGLFIGIFVWVIPDQSTPLLAGLAFGLRVGLFFGLPIGLFFGLAGGLDAVIYYWLLTRYLDASGSFPMQPDRFLEWCAGTRDPEASEGTTTLDRRWMRQVGGQFQFRHRKLQEHLAQSYLPPTSYQRAMSHADMPRIP